MLIPYNSEIRHKPQCGSAVFKKRRPVVVKKLQLQLQQRRSGSGVTQEPHVMSVAKSEKAKLFNIIRDSLLRVGEMAKTHRAPLRAAIRSQHAKCM